MTKAEKQVLLSITAELETLRSLVDVLARRVPGLTLAEAHEARNLALQEHSEFFDKLRQQIEVLA